ncbi:MAG: hypothetical protein LBV41_10815 [Cytophagaceae bacterium]|jgi:hypothetical protein|nr:hypothetical protein [Cytophagaceae bacterium]
MEENFYSKLTLLNNRGKRLQKMLLVLSDEELREMTPSPSFRALEELKRKALLFSMFLTASLN